MDTTAQAILDRFEQWAIVEGECQYCGAYEVGFTAEGRVAEGGAVAIEYRIDHTGACPVLHLEAAIQSLQQATP